MGSRYFSLSSRLRGVTTLGPGRILAATLLLTLTLTIVAAAKGEERIDPAVRAELSKLAPSEQTTVLFLLERQADVSALDRTLTSHNASRRERHQQVVELLQAEARMSQAPFLAELSLRSHRGEVTGYAPYWIMNLVVVHATRAAIEDLAGRPDIARVEPSIRLRPMEPIDVRPTGNENSPLRGVGVPPGSGRSTRPRSGGSWASMGAARLWASSIRGSMVPIPPFVTDGAGTTDTPGTSAGTTPQARAVRFQPTRTGTAPMSWVHSAASVPEHRIRSEWPGAHSGSRPMRSIRGSDRSSTATSSAALNGSPIPMETQKRSTTFPM